MYAIINITCRIGIISSHKLLGFVSFLDGKFVKLYIIRRYVTLGHRTFSGYCVRGVVSFPGGPNNLAKVPTFHRALVLDLGGLLTDHIKTFAPAGELRPCFPSQVSYISC